MLAFGVEASERVGELPSGLEGIQPGPDLGLALAATDRSLLTGFDVVRVMQAEHRQISFYSAGLYRSMYEVAHADSGSVVRSEVPDEFAVEEVRAALTMTRRMADIELNLALELVDRLPQVLEAFEQGDLDRARVRRFVTETAHLSDEDAATVADRVLPDASELTTGQLSRRLQRVVLEVAPDAVAEQREQGLEDRGVVLEANPNGTASLAGHQLAPDRTVLASERINQLARSLKTGDETRTMDQLRADVFLDLLTGADVVGGSGGGVDITVDLKTLTQLSDAPGELAGYGPVAADISRQVAEQQENTQWSYAVTDNSGELIAVGTTRRRPTKRQQRWVQARDRTGVFPGCVSPARKADIDHRHPHAQGGQTTVDNLQPLCKRHHTLKHHGWKLTLTNHTHQWTSPFGHTYTTTRGPPDSD